MVAPQPYNPWSAATPGTGRQVLPVVQADPWQALWFGAAAFVIGLIIMRLRPPMRRGVVATLLMVGVGLGALAVLAHLDVIGDAHVARGRSSRALPAGDRAVRHSYRHHVLRQRAHGEAAVPRILGEVAIVISLAVFALVRMDAEGVNLASIVTTSAVLTGIIGFFAALDSVGNMWGGVAATGQFLHRRLDRGRQGDRRGGRRTAALHRASSVNNVTIIIPNQTLVTTRVTLLGRRGDHRVPWRRGIDFEVGYEWTPGQVIAVVDAAFVGVDIPGACARSCAFLRMYGFRCARHQIRPLLLVHRHSDYATVDSSIRVHIFAALSRAGMEIPISRSDMFLHSASNIRSNAATREQQARVELLESLELFAALNDVERETVPHDCNRCRLRRTNRSSGRTTKQNRSTSCRAGRSRSTTNPPTRLAASSPR